VRSQPTTPTLPLLALIAGVILLWLEYRGGWSFWSVFAMLLIGFALVALLAPGAPDDDDNPPPDHPP
jgi:hypothetical protein